MDDKQMSYFLQVCKYQNISKAAQSLYISQQALSAALHRLEQELNVPLFERTNHGMALTEYGAYVQKEIEQICSIRKHMQSHLDSMRSGYRQTLQIGVSFGVINALPERFFTEFEKLCPEIELRFQEYADIRCEEAVLSGKEELGFGILPIDHRNFQIHTVIQDPVCILASESHPLSRRGQVSFEELQNEHFLLPTEEFKLRHMFMERCRSAGFEPKILLETMETILIHNFTRLNKGLGVSAVYSAGHIIGVRKIPLGEENCKWEACLFRDRHFRHSKAAQAFWSYVCSRPLIRPENV